MIRRLVLSLAAGVAALAGCADSPPERIVLVVADTLRRDHLSPYGARRETPHLAALAARGQVFPDVQSAFNQTSMSMGSLFTGRTPSIESRDPERPLGWNGSTWCGMARFAGPDAPEGVCLPDSLPVLGERMREAGYWTMGAASNMFLFDPAGFSRGFDDWVEVGERVAERAFAEKRARPEGRSWKWVDTAVRELLARRPRDRFFLYVHYMDAHDYGPDPAGYPDGVAEIDRALGVLVQRLQEWDLLEDSVVVFTSDHGERLTERHALPGQARHLGNPSFQEVLEVPLVIAPPVVDEPARITRLPQLFDLLLEIAGSGPAVGPDLDSGEHYIGERRYQTYRKGRWKSMRPRGSDALVVFDLLSDPGETRDVAGARPSVVTAHRQRMQELSAELSAGQVREREMSPEDEQRLRVLGYLE